jgi:hypothetical protein
MLLQASRMAAWLSKEGASLPGLPGATVPIDVGNPHGTDGRLRRSAAPRVVAKKTEGPRAHGPRLAPPSP